MITVDRLIGIISEADEKTREKLIDALSEQDLRICLKSVLRGVQAANPSAFVPGGKYLEDYLKH